jgi:hypothetical protein
VYQINFTDRSIVVGSSASGGDIAAFDTDGVGGVDTWIRNPGVILPGDELRSWAAAHGITPPTTPGLVWPATSGFPFEVTTLITGLIADAASPAFVNSAFCSLGIVAGPNTCDVWWNASPSIGAKIEAWVDTVPGASLLLRTGTPAIGATAGSFDATFRASTGAVDGTLLFEGAFIHTIPTATVVTNLITKVKTSPSSPVLLVTSPTGEGLTFVTSGGATNTTSGAEATNAGIIDVDQSTGTLGPQIKQGPAGVDGVGESDITFNAQSFFSDRLFGGVAHQGPDTVCVGTASGDTTTCTGAPTVSADSLDPLLFTVIPNPAALLLMGSGLLGLGMFARRTIRK